MFASPSFVVAVVGGGFSGVMTALHILRYAADTGVILIEHQPSAGLGAAYSTLDPDHLLNVRAGNMSAWPDRPSDFLDWTAQHGPKLAAGDFATRADYGRYLKDLLARQADGEQRRLTVICDEVVDLCPTEAGWRLSTKAGRVLAADGVVLALGNPSPGAVPGLEADLAASPRYVADPWRWRATSDDANDEPILLLGTGLTMVDVVLTLSSQAPRRPLVALSRRGLTSRRHSAAVPDAPSSSPSSEASPLATLQWLRRCTPAEHWRGAVDALRPVSQALWRHWTARQKTSFLRHARAYWDVHRHRLAPVVADRLDGLVDAGRLRIETGRLSRLELEEPKGVRVTWRPRGGAAQTSQVFEQVINCTGPAGDIRSTPSPLLGQLFQTGLARPDPLSLGIDVDETSRVIDRDGRAHPGLLAVGPVTKGAFWEIIAVPDIRVQAAAVAQALVTTPRPQCG